MVLILKLNITLILSLLKWTKKGLEGRRDSNSYPDIMDILLVKAIKIEVDIMYKFCNWIDFFFIIKYYLQYIPRYYNVNNYNQLERK